MTSSSRPSPSERLHQTPPPPTQRASAAYTRFIPREELQGFAAWRPHAFAETPSFVQPAQPGAVVAVQQRRLDLKKLLFC